MPIPGPLSGVTVLDLSRILAGPYCTLLMAELGARVIKVESPGTGDDARAYGPFVNGKSAYFASINRGKEAIALDLKNDGDRAIFEKLLSITDVLVENFRPGTMEKLGYGWETLHPRFPRLIYAAASGFGHTGPYSGYPAYDMVVQGLGGIMSITGHPGVPPARIGMSIGDVGAGLFTAVGVNAALFHRANTGEATKIDIGMFDVQLALLENAVVRYTTTGLVPGPMGARHPSICPFEPFATADGDLIIAAGNDGLFKKLCRTLGLERLIDDPRYFSNHSRFENADALKADLEAVLGTRPITEWVAVLDAAGIPCGPDQQHRPGAGASAGRSTQHAGRGGRPCDRAAEARRECHQGQRLPRPNTPRTGARSRRRPRPHPGRTRPRLRRNTVSNAALATPPASRQQRLKPNLDPHALAQELSGKLLIGGELRPALSGKTFGITNPATGETIAEAAEGEAADVDLAVSAAAKAQKDWGKMLGRERGKLVAECGRLLADHVEEIARLIALETGKALRTESRVEANTLVDCFTFFGGLGSELKGESVPFKTDSITITQHDPIGVVGAIIPWNVPLLLMSLKIAPALVAGNGVVVKSAEEAPLAVLRVCQIINQILPPGILNILSGYGPECGAPLVAHKGVGKVTFTGSVETGRIVYKAAAEKLIPVTLELGGKSPMIVMEDADLEKAVTGAIVGMRFTRQGQSCTAASRIFVQDKIHDAFVARLKAKVDAMVMGDPLDEKTDIGTIISPEQFSKVKGYIEFGEGSAGAKALRCSAMPEDARLKKGLYVQPVIFTGIANDNKLAQEEIFGPVTCIIRFSEYEEALAQANDSDFGLAATIWTSNLKTALDASQRLEAGLVQVNQNLVVQPNMSYGGIKSSGLGKEATLESMLEHFTHKKTIILNMG